MEDCLSLSDEMMEAVKRASVVALAIVDEALDELLYRPAVVKAFAWLPRWWLCDLAKLSIRLDTQWGTGWWSGELEPGGPCDACIRRASIHVYGGPDPEDDEDVPPDYLTTRPIHLCGWCHIGGPIENAADLERELALARSDSVAWRWRWRLRPWNPGGSADR